MAEKIRIYVFVSGYVHGVTFRANTVRRARALSLTGWVKNTHQGLEAVFEGRGEAIKEIIKWMKKGPRGAVVKSIDIKQEPYTGEFTDFEVLF